MTIHRSPPAMRRKLLGKIPAAFVPQALTRFKTRPGKRCSQKGPEHLKTKRARCWTWRPMFVMTPSDLVEVCNAVCGFRVLETIKPLAKFTGATCPMSLCVQIF